jgi:hypothetical protein
MWSEASSTRENVSQRQYRSIDSAAAGPQL